MQFEDVIEFWTHLTCGRVCGGRIAGARGIDVDQVNAKEIEAAIKVELECRPAYWRRAALTEIQLLEKVIQA